MESLLKEYRESKRLLIEYKEHNELSDDEKAHVNAMISNCEYAIRWLRCGHKPGNMRGAERLASYQREKAVDPLIMQSYYDRSQGIYNGGAYSTVSEGDVRRIEEALSVLTERERDCYMMAYGQGFTHSQIAEMLLMDRRNVNTLIQRAQMKLSRKYYQIKLQLEVV